MGLTAGRLTGLAKPEERGKQKCQERINDLKSLIKHISVPDLWDVGSHC